MTELTSAKKRVQIAMDVIKHLNTEVLVSKPQQYLSLDSTIDLEVGHTTQVQTVLEAQKKPCNVCALGACFISMIRRYNDLAVGDLETNEWDAPVNNEDKRYGYITSHLGNLSQNLMPYLERIFDKDQLLAIEVAYEGANHSGSLNCNTIVNDEALLEDAHLFHMERAEYDRKSFQYVSGFGDDAEYECGKEDAREDDGSKLLRDIMKNIIRNKGTFVP